MYPVRAADSVLSGDQTGAARAESTRTKASLVKMMGEVDESPEWGGTLRRSY